VAKISKFALLSILSKRHPEIIPEQVGLIPFRPHKTYCLHSGHFMPFLKNSSNGPPMVIQ